MIARSRRPTGVNGKTARRRWICAALSPRGVLCVTFGRSRASQGFEVTTFILIKKR
jgi:hypothetical protein